MPTLKTYDLFLSHSWNYDYDYHRLVEMLKLAPNFYWRNYSVPQHDPLINPNSPVGVNKLISMLDSQIRPVNCVIFLGGMYAAHSDWIQAEINIAVTYNKPILAIYPWGQERMPIAIQKSANMIVGWNTDTIVNAIRKISL